MNNDKFSVLQVIGCLIRQPVLLLDDNYHFTEKDFPERFHKIVYGAIEHLVKSGVQELNHTTIDDFISKYPKQYKVFTDNDGMDYILNAVEMSDVENFKYYYSTLKKFSLLNQLGQHGFNTSLIYDPSIIDLDENSKMQTKFDNMSIEDILGIYEKDIAELRDSYGTSAMSSGCQAAQGMAALKEKYKELPEMGMPMGSAKLTTILRGRRLKKLYLKTSPSGFGKTRISVGDACCVSIPTLYDSVSNKWVNTNCQEPSLIISTELEIDEIQTMIAAYVSDVSEDHILDGKYKDGEEARVDKAIKIIEESPLYIEHVPNFNIDDIEYVIKKYKVKYNIGYVFFDYVFTSIKILTEVATKARGVKIREDNVLIMFVDRMKTLCNTLNIHIDTSSQANGDWKNAKDGDQNLIRGAKGIADKVDVGIVILPPSLKDLENVKTLIHNGFSRQPNLVYHIYKVRRGKTNHVKLWVYFDYSTCRTYDLFVTDNDYKKLDIESTSVEMILDQTEEEKANDFFY